MWRPFASQFVNHSYSDFLRKHCDRDFSQRAEECRVRPRRFNATDLFPHKLHTQAFELRAQEFQRLKAKLNTQRSALEQQENKQRRLQRLLGRKHEQAQTVRAKYKQEYQAYLRSKAGKGVKLPRVRAKPAPKPSIWKRVDIKAVLALKCSSNSPSKSCR